MTKAFLYNFYIHWYTPCINVSPNYDSVGTNLSAVKLTNSTTCHTFLCSDWLGVYSETFQSPPIGNQNWTKRQTRFVRLHTFSLFNTHIHTRTLEQLSALGSSSSMVTNPCRRLLSRNPIGASPSKQASGLAKTSLRETAKPAMSIGKGRLGRQPVWKRTTLEESLKTQIRQSVLVII